MTDSNIPRRFARIDSFASLKPGWYWDGEGEAINSEVRNGACELVMALGEECSDYGIFPTPEGGILFEWDAINVEYDRYGVPHVMRFDGRPEPVYGEDFEDEVGLAAIIKQAVESGDEIRRPAR